MAVGDEYLASVRHSVRLSSTVHDGELTDLINAARADLVLGGVLEAKANDETDPLIKKAVTTYVKGSLGSTTRTRTGSAPRIKSRETASRYRTPISRRRGDSSCTGATL